MYVICFTYMLNPSICIPKVEGTVNKSFIYKVFDRYNFGKIKKIDLIKTNNYKRAFIHYSYWHDNNNANYAKDLILSGEDIKLIYSMPWYWICKLSIHS